MAKKSASSGKGKTCLPTKPVKNVNGKAEMKKSGKKK